MPVPHESVRTLSTSGTCILVVPKVKTQQSEAAFYYHPTQPWNNLADYITPAQIDYF